MAFDGVTWMDSSFIYPFVYHARAPCTGVALSTSLRTAYVYALHQDRRVLQQNYALNFRNETLYRVEQWLDPNPSAFVRLAEGFRRVPLEATHLVGEALFRTHRQPATFHHRIVAIGGGTATGATISVFTASAAEAYETRQDPDLFIGAYGGEYYRSEFEVALLVGQAGTLLEIYIEGFGEWGGGSIPPSYSPQAYSAWWEIR